VYNLGWYAGIDVRAKGVDLVVALKGL